MGKRLGTSAGRTAGRSAGEGEEEARRVLVSDDEAEDLSDEALEIYETIESAREQIGDDEQGKVIIQRRLPDGTLATLPSLPVKTFSVDLVAQKYGGGKYFVRWYKGKKYIANDHFTVDPSVKPAPEPSEQPVGVAVNPALVQMAATNAAMEMIMKSQSEMVKALVGALGGAKPAAEDKGASALDIGLKIAERIAAASKPAAEKSESFTDQLDVATKLVNLGKSLVGEGGGDSGDAYMGAVTKMAEPIIDLVKLRVQREAERKALPPGRRNAVTPPAAAPAAIPPTSGGQPTMGVPTWLLEVQRWVPMMVKRASNGRSAEDTAFFILDELSEPTLQELAKLAAMPDFGAQVARVLPAELNNQPEWVTEFLSAVQDYLFGGDEGPTASDEPEPEEPEGGGDVLDLEAESKRRLALLDDAPPKEESVKEPQPTG